MRQKEHQVSAAILFSGTAAPPSEKKRERKNRRCSEVMAPSGPCVDFVIGLFPETHLPAVGEKSNTKNRSCGLLPC